MIDSTTESDTKALIEGMLEDEGDAATVSGSTAVVAEESANTDEIVTVTVEDEVETKVELLLEETMHISGLADLYQTLSSCMDKKQDILLDASQVKKVDTVSLQMLAAFYQSAPAIEINVSWADCSDNFKEASDLLGLSETLGI